MNCQTATESIEPLAAGDIECAGDLAAHLEACPRCAADLAMARAIARALASGGAQTPRHFTARVLHRLPPRAPEVRDGLEGWLDTAAAWALLPVAAGIWLLVDPAVLRRAIDTVGSSAADASALLLNPGSMLVAYAAIAVAGLMAVMTLGFLEET